MLNRVFAGSVVNCGPALVTLNVINCGKNKLVTTLTNCNHVNNDICIEVGLIAGYLGSAPPN